MEVEVDDVAFEIVARSGQGQNNNNKLKSSLFALAHIESAFAISFMSSLIFSLLRRVRPGGRNSILRRKDSTRLSRYRAWSSKAD